MKKILFNCATNTVGGGVKNSAIFIKYAKDISNINFFFAISTEVEAILKKWDMDTSDMIVFKTSPARDKQARKKLKKLADDLEVDTVFTMAGPAYVKFNQKHIMGISNPYITHADWQAFSIGKKLSQKIKTILQVSYQAYFSRKADLWIFQTEESRKGFCRRLFISNNKTAVVSNAIGEDFVEKFQNVAFKTIDKKQNIKIFSPAAPFLHKALETIPFIANELKKIAGDNYEFEFILTIDSDTELFKKIQKNINKLNVSNEVKTIGSFNYADAYKLYESSDIVFVPSILETFSASYLEALVAKKPLVISNKGFAKDICKKAAVYIDPFKYNETAQAIDLIINDKDIQIKLYENGQKIIQRYGTQKERFDKLLKILEGEI